MDDRIGQAVASRYRITGRLGSGGMGIVYLAVDEQLRRPVAVKFLSELGADRDRLSRFRNEALTLSALNHPHIVTVFEIGDSAGEPFIATEFVEGETLRQRLQAGPLPLRDAIEVAIQIARALDAAHARQLVHRDVKPDNVMIRRDGYVKLLDFGLAMLRGAGDAAVRAGEGVSLETVEVTIGGTPGYMAPEQIDAAAVDARTDVFALGVLLCEMLSGANPFARTTTLETLAALERTPEPAVDQLSRLPPSLATVIVKALQKDPSGRFERAGAVAEALKQVLAEIDAPAPRMDAASPRTKWFIAFAAVGVVALGTIAAFLYRRVANERWVRGVAVPQIRQLLAGERPVAAFALMQQAESYLPGNSDLQQLIAEGTLISAIQSAPASALVEVQDYFAPDQPWLRIGMTPLAAVRLPNGFLRWRVSKAGVGEYVVARRSQKADRFELDRAAAAPPGMVPVRGGEWTDMLAFLGWVGPYALPPYFIDQYEVTNRQYQEFVDAGGYRRREFWKQPFVSDGRELSWDDAISQFRDTTGRSGPSTWEGGHYAVGREDWPVTGVSWFEAAAYAEFARKSLPVIAQGYKAEPPDIDQYVARRSNLGGDLVAVGKSGGLGEYGTYDLIGNVREWYWNATSGNRRFALGRQAASYGPEALPPFDRSALNGFRCVQNSQPVPADAAAPLPLTIRDFTTVRPVGDDVFRAYRAMYAYDKAPLHAQPEPSPPASPDWTVEKMTIDAAYGRERLPIFLFLPRHTKPPFQTVVFFPSARVNFSSSSAALGDMEYIDYIIKSGRAVVYPVYQTLYERSRNVPTLPGPTLEREIMIEWSKDLGRTIDYLETRRDIDPSRLGYLGVSQGAVYGVILVALDDRLKTAALLDGGFFQDSHPLPGMDEADFAPRITKPVLMVNGRYDSTFPLEAAQAPMFAALGTSAQDKKHVVFETPHDVNLRRADLTREVLAWFDKYLGRVE